MQRSKELHDLTYHVGLYAIYISGNFELSVDQWFVLKLPLVDGQCDSKRSFVSGFAYRLSQETNP